MEVIRHKRGRSYLPFIDFDESPTNLGPHTFASFSIIIKNTVKLFIEETRTWAFYLVKVIFYINIGRETYGSERV